MGLSGEQNVISDQVCSLQCSRIGTRSIYGVFLVTVIFALVVIFALMLQSHNLLCIVALLIIPVANFCPSLDQVLN